MVVEPIYGGQEAHKAQNVKNRDVQKRDEAIQAAKSGGDSVEISESAREAAKVQETVEMVKSAPFIPDLVRKDKVEAAKERILGGNYLSPKVVDDIAEKIARLLTK